jgi:hypothetical protein
MCQNGSKFERHYVSPRPDPPDSPDIKPCNFWFFEMLKGVMKDYEFHSGEETEEAIPKV